MPTHDEFYTLLSDIEKELRYYKQHFVGKTVFCNCDDPRVSNFFKYFTLNFEVLGLKRVIATCYKNDTPNFFSLHKAERAVYQIYEGDKNGNRRVDPEEIEVCKLMGNGDFRSTECKELLKQADIVCTNPPFSLFRDYIAQLITYDKKFLILGNVNAITYKEVFPLIKTEQIWLGISSFNQGMYFGVPDDFVYAPTYKFDRMREGQKVSRVSSICWFTNLDHDKRHEELPLYKHYTPEEYPKYDNYDAINVKKVSEIPLDYDGVMGVPITFLDKYCPEQFEIVGLDRYVEDNPRYGHRFTIKGKETYARILIRRK
ncbi:MAG: adenine-specific methyltransferase EcoRI family protein [Bacteroidaceae bacterium]|nr:adenine-specific methyltransferase EcoRI family protein [Bacteroidaceae bacterium]